MTSDLYEDLGGRLDDLAASFTSDIELTNPASLPQPRSGRRFGKGAAILVANAAVIVLIVVFALWGRSSGPEVSEISDTVLEDLLPEWAAVTPGVDVDGWLDQSELSALFDISTVRQIDFEPGAVFVGLDPAGRNVVVAVGSRLDGAVLGSTSITLPDLFRDHRLIVRSRGSLQVTTFGGVAPAGAVAVWADGERYALKSGAFLVEFPPGLEFPGRVEFEFADGTIAKQQGGYGPGASGAGATVSARIEGVDVNWALESVTCALVSTSPDVLEFSASRFSSYRAGESLPAPAPPDELILALRAEGLYLLGVNRDQFGAFLPLGEFVFGAAEPGMIEMSWNTDTTSGSATVDCGDFIVDAAELRSLLRAGPLRAEVLPEWADVPVGFGIAALPEGVDSSRVFELFSGVFDITTVRQIDFESVSIFLGVGTDGRSLVLGYANRVGFEELNSTRGSLASQVVSDWARFVTASSSESTTVVGVVPRGVVKVTVAGRAAELRSGAFVATFDSALDSPESNVNFSDIEVEFSDGTVHKLGRTAARAGATILEATIDGAAVQVRPERVACTYTGRDPATIEVRTLSGFLDAESLVVADLVDGEVRLDGFNDDGFFGARIASEDLSVQISDSLREVSLSWDTDESTGSMFIDCGSTLFDMNDLVELLRAN